MCKQVIDADCTASFFNLNSMPAYIAECISVTFLHTETTVLLLLKFAQFCCCVIAEFRSKAQFLTLAFRNQRVTQPQDR